MKPKHPQAKKTPHASQHKHQSERQRRLIVQRKKEEAK